MDDTNDTGLREQIRRLKLIQYISMAMNKTADHKELLTLMLERSMDLVGADSGSIMIRVPGTDELRYEVYRGLEDEAVRTHAIKIGQGLTGTVFEQAQPKLSNDVTMEPLYISVRPEVMAELAVPLIVQGQVIGVLNVDSSRRGAFSDADLDLLQTLANQASQILQKTALYEDLGRKINIKDLLLEAARLTARGNGLDEVFEAVMKLLAERFGIERGMLVLVAAGDPTKLSVQAAFNITQAEISRGIYKLGEGVVGRIVEEGRAMSVRDITEDPGFLNRMQIKRDKRAAISFIGAPIRIEGATLGALAVEKRFTSDTELADDTDLVTLTANLLGDRVRSHQRALEEKQWLITENERLKNELKGDRKHHNIIGSSPAMQKVFDLIDSVADSGSSIMVRGESGTGKELVARAIHAASPRKDGPFISINCASIPETLLESELFGYKKGAFTGAVKDRKGRFELATGGTIFLDEIGDMPIALQVKLLRAIQEREIEPVGGEERVKIDIRIVSATHQDLGDLIAKGKFREDLFYRLNVVEILLPALRERKEDIALLVSHLIKKHARKDEKDIRGISPEALRILQNHGWPGNVRELENVLERAVLLCRGKVIGIEHMPVSLLPTENIPNVQVSRWVEGMLALEGPEGGGVYDRVIGSVEKELISKALIRNGRNKLKTATWLGIHRNTLKSKMEDYGIKV